MIVDRVDTCTFFWSVQIWGNEKLVEKLEEVLNPKESVDILKMVLGKSAVRRVFIWTWTL